MNNQPTPKAITALQKLLSQNVPSKSQADLHKSQSQIKAKKFNETYEVKLDMLLKKDMKSELLHALKQKNNKASDYKKKRPPELFDLGEEQSPIPISSKSKKSPKYFYTSTNARSQNVFGSINEVLKQYVHAQKQAGTGEGVKVPMCQSARNADREEKEKQQFLSEKKTKSVKQPTNQLLQDLYVKTAKLLSAFKQKELQWKQQKQSLRAEVQFLKQLLVMQDQ
ncbi:hypothetical protein pb186bvf_017227 [Paramecium bursaria]